MEKNNNVQRAEIKIDKLQNFVTTLIEAGYQCLVWSDMESMDYIVVEYLHPEFTGTHFVPEDDWTEDISEDDE